MEKELKRKTIKNKFEIYTRTFILRIQRIINGTTIGVFNANNFWRMVW
jgi:hypothetical protein